jgi:hypothetical protein
MQRRWSAGSEHPPCLVEVYEDGDQLHGVVNVDGALAAARLGLARPPQCDARVRLRQIHPQVRPEGVAKLRRLGVRGLEPGRHRSPRHGMPCVIREEDLTCGGRR